MFKASISLTLFLLFGMLNTGFAQSTESKNVSNFTIEDTQLDSHRKIWVYLPKSYNFTEKSYPVLYLQDAQNLFDKSSSFAGEWRGDEILDSLKTEMIVVGIEHGGQKELMS